MTKYLIHMMVKGPSRSDALESILESAEGTWEHLVVEEFHDDAVVPVRPVWLHQMDVIYDEVVEKYGYPWERTEPLPSNVREESALREDRIQERWAKYLP